MAEVQLEDLSKQFGELEAIKNVNFKINDGEFLVIVGPSGCGKSTTLNCVAGLEKPTSGKIRVGGSDITDLTPRERNIAMVFQNYALYPHMTVRENMEFGLKMSSDKSTAAIESKVEEMAELLGIKEHIEAQPKELSGGQQQRVALGRAIIREPDVFLLDEPLSNLDAKLRTEMRTELQQLQSDLGITTVYVTHDQVEAMTMGDRIAIMNDGELQQIDTPLEVYYNPANQFVAGFIGSPSMNFFDVTKENTGSTCSLTHDLFSIEVPSESEELNQAASDLVLGVRPDSFNISGSSSDSTINTVVDVVEPMGESNYSYFTHKDTTYTVNLGPEELPTAGEKVSFEFSEEDIYLFDRDSQQTILTPGVKGQHQTTPESNLL
jgi:multiple sugar transport system ATP-binding protein